MACQAVGRNWQSSSQSSPVVCMSRKIDGTTGPINPEVNAYGATPLELGRYRATFFFLAKCVAEPRASSAPSITVSVSVGCG